MTPGRRGDGREPRSATSRHRATWGTEQGEWKDLGEVSRGQQSIYYIHEGHEKTRREPCVFLSTKNTKRHEEKRGVFTAPACFYGFPCCDASLRNEGCFFSGVSLPKLASEQVGTGEETKGAALASQQEVFMVFVKGIFVLLSTQDPEVFPCSPLSYPQAYTEFLKVDMSSCDGRRKIV